MEKYLFNGWGKAKGFLKNSGILQNGGYGVVVGHVGIHFCFFDLKQMKLDISKVQTLLKGNVNIKTAAEYIFELS